MAEVSFEHWPRDAYDVYQTVLCAWEQSPPDSEEELLAAAVLADLCEEYRELAEMRHWRAWAVKRTKKEKKEE